MAEAIALGASIIAVIQISDRIIGLTKQYIEAVQGVSRDLHVIHIETSTLKAIFESLKLFYDSEKFLSDNLQSLDGQNGPIEGCRRSLFNLERLLGPDVDTTVQGKRRKIQATLSGLAWPLKESKARKLLDEDLSGRRDIKDVRNGMNQLRERKEHQDILDWLTAIDYAPQQNDFISRRQEGTGQWLLNSNEFQEWLNTKNQTLFCLGIPGAGKTIITSIAVDDLFAKFRNDARVGIAYIYCNFRRQQEQKCTDLLASLLKQLIQEKCSMPENVESLYERHKGKRTRPLFDEISKALHSIVVGYSRVFIIVDALDEFQISDGGRKRFLAELFDLQDRIGVSLFVTSRFIPEIIKDFEGRSTQLEIRASDDDLQRYLDGHMLKLPSFVSRNANLQSEIKVAIVNAVDGMFLLAQLHLDSLIGKRSPKTIRLALGKLPKGSEAYDHAYKEAMERIGGQVSDSQELAKQVLSWITCAIRPVTTLELRHALAVEIGESELHEDNIPEIEDMVSVCAGLVTVDEESDIIRLVHYTTQEYFERTQILWFPDAQRDITTACVTYLSFDAFESGFCPTNEEFETRLQLNPLYDYAAQNWGHHAYIATTEIVPLILDFLENEAKVSSSSQALMTSRGYSGDSGYSQRVPKRVIGVHLAAYFGMREAVIALLKNGYHPDSKDNDGRTPLSWAAENGHKAVVRLLLATDGVDPNSIDSDGRTPLSWAAVNGYKAVVKLLLTKDGVDPDFKDTKHGQTPLSWAAEEGHEAVVSLLLTIDGVDPDSKDKDDRTPLSLAAEYGHETVVKLLLAKNVVNPDSKDKDDRTPLLLAAANGHEAVVKLLLAKDGVDPNFKNSEYCQTPLSLAAVNGHKAVVKLLLTKDGVDPDSKDKDDRTPLLLAAAKGHEAVVKLLLAKNGVNPDSKNKNGRTPLLLAAVNGHETVVKLLLAKDGVDTNSKESEYCQTPLLLAAANGHETVVKLILSKDGVDPDSKDKNGRTPLLWAAVNGHETVIKLLLAKDGVDPDSKDKNGRTPLSWAAVNGRDAVITLLLTVNGVDPDSTDQNGRTPLCLAAKHGHEAVVKLLVEKGAELESKDNKNGRTPLLWAAANGHEMVVKLLLATDGIDPDFKDNGGWTPLSLAAGRGHEPILKLLIAKDGIDLDSKNKSGRTPLSWAAWNGQKAVVEVLLATDGVDPDSKDTAYGRTPLWLAAANGHEAVVELLLATDGIDPDFKDNEGWTPLSCAAERGHEAVVKLLLAKDGVDLNSKDTRFGRTPLSLAAERGHEAVVKLLLATDGVDLDCKDTEYGGTPLWWAAEKGHRAVVELLLATDGVDLNSKDTRFGRTPLSCAAERGHEAVVKLLLAKDGVDLNSKDTRFGRTPLSWAGGMGHEAIVKTLLANEVVDLNSQDRYGQTPLLLSAGNGHEAVVKLLLANGVFDADSKDKFNRTPLSWAARRGNSNIVKILLEKYNENGIAMRDEDVDTATPTAANHPSCITCEICLLWIPDVDIHYHCKICSVGDFDICQECIASGAFCFDQSHKLIKRTVKDGTLVEVPD